MSFGDIPAVGAPGPGWATDLRNYLLAVDSHLGHLVDAVDLDSLPDPGTPGRLARFTNDPGGILFDTGTEWRVVGVDVGGGSGVFPATAFGQVGEGVDPDTNRATIQAALNAARDEGGGIVVPPPGVVDVFGLQLDHRVWIDGRGRTTLRHPDPDTQNVGSLIQTKLYTTTGSINAGSNVLSVEDATGLKIGCAISIVAAGPSREDGGQGNEPLYSVVNGISGGPLGATITLDHLAVNTVSALFPEPVRWGPLTPGVRDIRLDGNRSDPNPSGSPGELVRFNAVYGGVVERVHCVNAVSHAVMFDIGSAYCQMQSGSVYNSNRMEGGGSGFSVFIFRGSHHCTVRDVAIHGITRAGVKIDHSTATKTPLDQAPTHNTVEGCKMRFGPLPSNYGVGLEGARYNQINGNDIEGPTLGVELNTTNGVECSRNRMVGNTIRNCVHGIRFQGGSFGNMVTANQVYDCSTGDITYLGANEHATNLVYGNQTSQDDPQLATVGNVNTVSPGVKIPTLATADLHPHAGPRMRGLIVVEDTDGESNVNLVYYANGRRFRLTGSQF